VATVLCEHRGRSMGAADLAAWESVRAALSILAARAMYLPAISGCRAVAEWEALGLTTISGVAGAASWTRIFRHGSPGQEAGGVRNRQALRALEGRHFAPEAPPHSWNCLHVSGGRQRSCVFLRPTGPPASGGPAVATAIGVFTIPNTSSRMVCSLPDAVGWHGGGRCCV